MNFEWEEIAKEFKKIHSTVLSILKIHFKNYYKKVKKNDKFISFINLLIYWIHIKLNLHYSVICSISNMELAVKNYLEIIFKNPNFNFFTSKNFDLKFLKEKLPKIIDSSTNDLALLIFEIFKSYNCKIEFKNLKSFIDSILYFFTLNDNVRPFNEELKENLNNLDDYNANTEIFLYSLEIFKNARDVFATFDRENLANITVAINRLSRHLSEK